MGQVYSIASPRTELPDGRLFFTGEIRNGTEHVATANCNRRVAASVRSSLSLCIRSLPQRGPAELAGACVLRARVGVPVLISYQRLGDPASLGRGEPKVAKLRPSL